MKKISNVSQRRSQHLKLEVWVESSRAMPTSDVLRI